ncbi:adenylyl-sulfate kinase [Candidatus Omnitrophota bacterium]
MEHRGLTVWFTGLPGSGKSTVANLVAEKLKAKGFKVERLDGDIVRKGLTRDLGFSKEDRNKNIERVTFVAKLLTRNGVIVLSSFVSPYRAARENARQQIHSFCEVYVKCSLEECIRRDVKGMYKKAIAGEIKEFTGISDPYQEPDQPELIVETDKQTPAESAKRVLAFLEQKDLSGPQAQVEAQAPACTEEEKEQVIKRLKSLGYL